MAPTTRSSGGEPVASASTASSQGKSLYLIAYNFVSVVLWATVLGRTAGAVYLRGPEFVPLAVATFLRWTQTLALLEVAHSAFGTPSLFVPFPFSPPFSFSPEQALSKRPSSRP